MMINQDLHIHEGSVLILKKSHPCGVNRWKLTSFGVICKIKCLGCGRIVIIDRTELKKKIKKVVEDNEKNT